MVNVIPIEHLDMNYNYYVSLFLAGCTCFLFCFTKQLEKWSSVIYSQKQSCALLLDVCVMHEVHSQL